MADKHHLSVIRRGVNTWNRWRNKDVTKQLRPDLTGADLSGKDLERQISAIPTLVGQISLEPSFVKQIFTRRISAKQISAKQTLPTQTSVKQISKELI
jgi:hypothetical protein